MVALVFGVILLGIAIALFFSYKGQTNKAFSVQSAQSMTPGELHATAQAIAEDIGGGNWREYVKLWGKVGCDRPLTSVLKPTPCVFYKTTVTWEYEETVTKTDEDGKRIQETQKQSETLMSDRQSAPFLVQDETGHISVEPEGADLDTIDIVNDFQPAQPRGGLLSYGDFSLDVNSYARRSERRTLGYRYREAIMPLDRNVLVVGMVSDHTGELVVQKSLKADQSFIVSFKNDETLAQQSKKGAQQAFYGMVACGVLGIILIVLGLATR